MFDEVIVVDDGSKEQYSIEKIITNKNIRLFKVLKDYGFNSHGCRNLIMSKSTNEWVVLLDSDRLFVNPEISINIIRNKKLNLNTVYKFVAHSFKLGEKMHESVNDFLISKQHFFSVGGYDEELIGMRTGDRQFLEQLKHSGNSKMLADIDIILTRRPSVHSNNKEIVSKYDRVFNTVTHNIIEKRIKKPEPNKPILTFEWKEL